VKACGSAGVASCVSPRQFDHIEVVNAAKVNLGVAGFVISTCNHTWILLTNIFSIPCLNF